MTILGIDPGFAIVGYGVIQSENSRLLPVDYGVITTDADMPMPVRLARIYDGLTALLQLYKPDCAAFEELFFCNNVKTAINVGQARGVLLLAAQKSGLPLYEYTPMQIKMNTTGNGHADKKQVQAMVKLMLNLKAVPKPDDAADALAAAICHAGIAPHALEEFRIK